MRAATVILALGVAALGVAALVAGATPWVAGVALCVGLGGALATVVPLALRRDAAQAKPPRGAFSEGATRVARLTGGALLLVWALGLLLGATAWAAWASFAFACALLLASIAGPDADSEHFPLARVRR